MCITAPARVISIDSDSALVDQDGRQRRASLLVRPEVRVGDWVIVGAGTVLRRIAAEDAAYLINALHSATALAPPPNVDLFDEATPPEAAGGPS